MPVDPDEVKRNPSLMCLPSLYRGSRQQLNALPKGDSMPSDAQSGAGSLPGGPDRDAMNAILVEHWWTIMLRGAIGVLFGLIALTAPGAVLLSLALLFGIYLLADGVLGLIGTVRAVRVHGHWAALLAEAVLNILMGLIALFIPGAAVLAFVLLVAVWALISGGLMLSAALRLHASHGRWWLALGGIASLIWGVMLVAAPMVGAVVLAWWIGAYAIVFGVALLACGWRLRGQRVA
jgi:uncharacterized membrane protein HdeD (DUF308 family)